MERFDVGIIGAGPAGASAALELERLGIDHVLVEKEAFPRPKPCAGILPPKITDLVGAIPPGVRERRIRGYCLHTISGAEHRSRFTRPGYSVNRAVFDGWLVSKLRHGPRIGKVVAMEPGRGDVRVHAGDFDFRCRILIGADGANSRARAASGVLPPRMAAAYQADFADDARDITARTGSWFHVFYVVPGGYGWVAPHRASIKAGIGSLLPEETGKKPLARFLGRPEVRELIGESAPVAIQVHRIPMTGPPMKTGRGSILLAGDAGGFVFPGTGEGIRYAIQSGRCAASAAAEALKEGAAGKELQRTYEKRLSEEGLLSLGEVDFPKILATPAKAERYVRRLTSLSRRVSSS